jgi:hypothetical protein
MPKKREPTSDAVEILHRRIYEGKPERLAALEEARANDEVARKIYALRTKAKLTRGQLGKRVGVPASVIEDLEEADYEGNYLGMLARIAAALNKGIEISLVPLKHKAQRA